MNSRMYIDYRKAQDAYNKRVQEEKDMLMEQLKMLEVIATPMAFERISKWMEGIGLCTFSFLELVNQTVCEVSKLRRIAFDESDGYLFCDCVSDSYSINLGYNRDGIATKVMEVFHVDNISSVWTEYQYQFNILNDGKLEMKLDSIKRHDEFSMVIFNACSGVAYVDCGEYSQTIKFKVKRIVNDVSQLEAYINVLMGNKVTDAKTLLQYLVTRFNVTEEEFSGLCAVEVTVKRFLKTVSDVSFRKGELVSVYFVDDDGSSYIVYADGTWKYRDSHWDITHTQYRSEIWHVNNYTGNDYEETLERAGEVVSQVRPEFFDTWEIEFAVNE